MTGDGAFGKALAAMLIAYLIAVSSTADFLAHQCGRFWFNYTFQLSFAANVIWIFAAIAIVVFLICLIRHVGQAVHWWFWLAFAVVVLLANDAYAATAPLGQVNAAGGDVRCVVRR